MEKYYTFLKTLTAIFTGFWIFLVLFLFTFREYYTIIKEEVPFKIKSRTSKFIQEGWIVWIKEGEKGFKNEVYKVIKINKKKIKTKKIYSTGILKKPKEGILIRGISKKRHPITVPKVTYVHYVFNMEATAYDPGPESNSVDWAGVTYLGWRARYGIAAVDPKVISLRSLIFVPGYGFAWTGDTGGDIKGKRIDLCYNTTKEALRWGRRKVKVYVLGRRPLSYYKNKYKKKHKK